MIKNVNLENFISQPKDNATLLGHIEKVVYQSNSLNEDIMHGFNSLQISEVGTIWLNCKSGPANSDKFSFLIKDVAIQLFFNRYGILTKNEVKNFIVICNNTTHISAQGTDKPYCLISTLNNLNNFILEKRINFNINH